MSELVAPGFEPVLERFTSETLRSETSTVVGLKADFSFAYFNEGWLRFASENDGPDANASRAYLGQSLFDFIPTHMHEYYRSVFGSVQQPSPSSRHPARIEYDCHSPDRYRTMSMTVYPAAKSSGYLVVHSLLSEAPLESRFELHHPEHRHDYTDDLGFIHQCAHCRRVKHPAEEGRWDMVPDFIEPSDLRISHTLCLFCRDVYWSV